MKSTFEIIQFSYQVPESFYEGISETLAKWDDFRTINWVEIIECPEFIFQQTSQLFNNDSV